MKIWAKHHPGDLYDPLEEEDWETFDSEAEAKKAFLRRIYDRECDPDTTSMDLYEKRGGEIKVQLRIDGELEIRRSGGWWDE